MANAGRVIAGTAKGLRLVAAGPGTRPLSDRVKQTLFAILEPDLRGATVLDLFAGSGAAAIEALSRGAARAILVEHDAAAVGAIERNLGRAGFGPEKARIVRGEAVAYLADRAAADGPFDVVLVDPPYDAPDLLDAALVRLGGPAGLLTTDARVVAKHFWRRTPATRVGLLASERERRFGDTTLTFYRRSEPKEEA